MGMSVVASENAPNAASAICGPDCDPFILVVSAPMRATPRIASFEEGFHPRTVTSLTWLDVDCLTLNHLTGTLTFEYMRDLKWLETERKMSVRSSTTPSYR